MSCGVYAIVNGVNQKAYVGSSVDIAARVSRHFNSLRRGDHYNGRLQAAFNKYGEGAFSCEVLGECDRSINARTELEQLWIDLLVSADKGYNICRMAMSVKGTPQTAEHIARRVSSRAGYTHSEETRAKLLEKAKQRAPRGAVTEATRAKLAKASTGQRHSEETRAKLSEIAKQRPPKSEETRKKASETMKKVRASRFWSSGSFRSKQT